MAIRLLAALALLLTMACGGSDGSTQPSGSTLVELKDSPWQVAVASTTLTAGAQTFFVKNAGTAAHDLTIIKSDLAPDKLPQEAGKAREDGRVAGTNTLNPGQTATLTVTLQAGNYIFICNEPGHYALGMHTQVVVH